MVLTVHSKFWPIATVGELSGLISREKLEKIYDCMGFSSENKHFLTMFERLLKLFNIKELG